MDRVTVAWIAKVRDELKVRGWSYRDLVEEISRAGWKCSVAGIGFLLQIDVVKGKEVPHRKSSHLVPIVSQVLGIPTSTVDNPELTEAADPREAELLKAFRGLPSDQKDTLIADLSARVKRT